MEHLSRPSGISLPFFLKRKWEKEQQDKKTQIQQRKPPAAGNDDNEQQTSNENKDDNTATNDEHVSPDAWEPQLRLVPDQELTRDETIELSNRIFTTVELEERIRNTTTAMFDIQRQLHRGEELYYEDTYTHGSVYKGWDAFVDMKDIGTTSSSGGGGATQASSNRRVPADSRWFSTSCGSVSRTTPPAPFPPPLSSQDTLSIAQLPTIPKQHENEQIFVNDPKTTKIRTPPSPGTTTIVKALASLPISPTSAENISAKTETRTENDPSLSSLSFRTSQRAPSSAAMIAIANTDSTLIISKPSSRLPTPSTKTDPGVRKKRKSTFTTNSEEPPSQKAHQKTFADEAKGGPKYAGSATGSSPKPAATVTTRGSKSESNFSISKFKNNQGASSTTDKAASKADVDAPTKREIPTKRQKEVETPVPRKRGRPRRKS